MLEPLIEELNPEIFVVSVLIWLQRAVVDMFVRPVQKAAKLVLSVLFIFVCIKDHVINILLDRTP